MTEQEEDEEEAGWRKATPQGSEHEHAAASRTCAVLYVSDLASAVV
jgi:hypothetical protein